MANRRGNGNSGSRGPNMRWSHGAASDGSRAYSWGAGSGSVPGGPSFGYGSGSATSDGGSGIGFGFGFRWGAGAAGSGQGPRQNQNEWFGDFGESHVPPFGARFNDGMPFSNFYAGAMFGPPRPPRPQGTDNGGRGRERGSAEAT